MDVIAVVVDAIVVVDVVAAVAIFLLILGPAFVRVVFVVATAGLLYFCCSCCYCCHQVTVIVTLGEDASVASTVVDVFAMPLYIFVVSVCCCEAATATETVIA